MGSKWIQSVKFGWAPFGALKDTFGAEVSFTHERSDDYTSDAVQAQEKILAEKLPAPKLVRLAGFDPDCFQVRFLAEGLIAHGHQVQILVQVEKGVQLPGWIPEKCWTIAVVKGQPFIPIPAMEVWYYPGDVEEIPHFVNIPTNPAPLLYIAKAGPVARLRKFLDEEPGRVWRGL